MYAVVNILGKQYKVEKNKFLYTPLMKNEKLGCKVSFHDVLLLENDQSSITVGTPTITGAVVTGKVLDHVKDDKIIVFKKKRRKGYKKKNGHRQGYSKILIEDIGK